MGSGLVLERAAVTWHKVMPPLLFGLDLAAESGCVTALCGPNGSGKSSLLNALSARAAPSFVAGRVVWSRSGDDVAWTKEQARRHAVLLQQAAPFFSTDRVSSYFSLYRGVLGFCQDRLDALIDRFSISDVLNKNLAHLSGGQWRRVQCAAHFAVHAPVRLLDEPETGLDRAALDTLMEELAHARARGETILIATHSPQLVARVADWVCYLESGVCRWSSAVGLFTRYGPPLG